MWHLMRFFSIIRINVPQERHIASFGMTKRDIIESNGSLETIKDCFMEGTGIVGYSSNLVLWSFGRICGSHYFKLVFLVITCN